MSALRVTKVKGKLLGSREELVVLTLGFPTCKLEIELTAELPEVNLRQVQQPGDAGQPGLSKRLVCPGSPWKSLG